MVVNLARFCMIDQQKIFLFCVFFGLTCLSHVQLVGILLKFCIYVGLTTGKIENMCADLSEAVDRISDVDSLRIKRI